MPGYGLSCGNINVWQLIYRDAIYLLTNTMHCWLYFDFSWLFTV